MTWVLHKLNFVITSWCLVLVYRSRTQCNKAGKLWLQSYAKINKDGQMHTFVDIKGILDISSNLFICIYIFFSFVYIKQYIKDKKNNDDNAVICAVFFSFKCRREMAELRCHQEYFSAKCHSTMPKSTLVGIWYFGLENVLEWN